MSWYDKRMLPRASSASSTLETIRIIDSDGGFARLLSRLNRTSRAALSKTRPHWSVGRPWVCTRGCKPHPPLRPLPLRGVLLPLAAFTAAGLFGAFVLAFGAAGVLLRRSSLNLLGQFGELQVEVPGGQIDAQDLDGDDVADAQ